MYQEKWADICRILKDRKDVVDYTDHLTVNETGIALLLKWLLNNHYLYITTEWVDLGSDEWEYGWKIGYLPPDKRDLKRRAPAWIWRESFLLSGGVTYSGAWPTPTEALVHGIHYALTKILV